MGFIAASLIYMLTALLAVSAFSAEEITHVSVIQADTGRETALKRKLPIGLIRARPGDRLVLSTGRTRKHIFLVSESRKSSLGNTIIRGETVSGGRVLLVIDDEARIKGHFQEPDGMVQVTTDEFGVMTAWREGIDTVPLPFQCEVEHPPNSDSLVHDQLQSHRSKTRTPVQASKFAIQEEEPEVRFARYGTGHATVRVLIYYDTSMADYIERLADFLIELTNDAFIDSFIPISLELAGIKPINVDDLTPNEDLVWAMYDEEAPFESIADDREAYSADLTATLRDAEDGQPDGESGGIAFPGNQFRVQTASVTRYTRYRPGEPFYPSYSFPHELGHNLSAKHARWQYTDEEMQAFTGFSYAYGYRIEGSRRTIMSYGGGGTRENGTFSNPAVLFEGQPMGVAFNKEGSAESSRAFWNNRHVASSLIDVGDTASEQVRERVAIYESECGEELEEGEERGVARRHYISLISDSGIRINSTHKIRPDGSARVYRYSSDSTYASHYDCRLPDEGRHSLGTEYVESFFRYIDPTNGELVESAHVLWEEDMEGDYSHIRVAHTEGGEAVGNTSLLLKEGSEHTVEFNADYGYKVTNIESSCDGRRAGNSYIVSVTSDDCRVEATFGKGDSGTLAQDNFSGLLSIIEGLGQPKPEPVSKDQFIGTYHVFRPQRSGRESIIRISADQSLAFDSNTTYYRWELNGDKLDAYYMYQPDDPGGDYRFSLSQDPLSGRIEVVDSYYTSSNWDFYGERKSTDSEADFDLYELGRDWWGEEQHVLKCFNIGRRELSFSTTSWYSDSQLPATSTDLEECRSYCPAILEDYQERDPDNWSDRVCEGDDSESGND
jgi:hypothetical protein